MADELRHPERKEIARYLLSRGTDLMAADEETEEAVTARLAMALPKTLPFPAGLEPAPEPIDPAPASDHKLPEADVVVITWTVDEVRALAHVFTSGRARERWHPYDRHFDRYADHIRPHAPARNTRRLGSYMPTKVGGKSVLCMKSELHLNQDGVKTGDGTATLPVKDFFKQIISEAKPDVLLTIGTAGGVYPDFQLGDVVVTRGAKFRLQNEFRNEKFNGKAYESNWKIPTGRFDEAEKLMHEVAGDLTEPPIGPPSKSYKFKGPLIEGPTNRPDIKLDGRDMPDFHPILTTDYFEYGTSENRLDKEGAAVEMGDAALGLACSELDDPPKWAVVRNVSDPVINGDLPTKEYHLNEQTTWAVGYYTAYGYYTSVSGALATWGIIAGLDS
jgi:Phosphorylase superfamily